MRQEETWSLSSDCWLKPCCCFISSVNRSVQRPCGWRHDEDRAVQSPHFGVFKTQLGAAPRSSVWSLSWSCSDQKHVVCGLPTGALLSSHRVPKLYVSTLPKSSCFVAFFKLHWFITRFSKLSLMSCVLCRLDPNLFINSIF